MKTGRIIATLRDAFRIRVANYRIICEIQDAILLVDVVDSGHREDVYK